jgi:hypothetical protein
MSVPPARVRRGMGGMLVDTGPLRRHAGFRRPWTGQLVASLGSQLTVVAVAYQTYRLTGSTAMVGLVSLGGLVPLLAGSLLGGPLVLSAGPRRAQCADRGGHLLGDPAVLALPQRPGDGPGHYPGAG